MSESAIDKKYIDNLLNALSISDALNMFSEIDKKITQLLQCSSDDFLGLNDHFKNAFKESKTISNNAVTIIQIISDVNAQQQFKQLQEGTKNIQLIAERINSIIGSLEINVKKSLSKYETFYISFNGLKQNLNSLKLLLANQKISDTTQIGENALLNIEKTLHNFKEIISETDIILINYKNISTEISLLLNKVQKNQSAQLITFSNSIKQSFSYYIEKHTQSTKLSPALKERIDNCSAHIAKIITNLQYHDIIRQKIEHIQGTHKDIVTELNTFAEQEPSQAILHSRVKTFLKIRDIAGLQAAQLLHANKQYQVAIEEISVSLEEIVNEMLAISELGSDLHRMQTNNLFFNSQADILQKATINSDIFKQIFAEINQKIDLFLQSSNETVLKANLITNEINSLFNSVNIVKEHSSGILKEQFEILIDNLNVSNNTFIAHANDIFKKSEIINTENLEFKNIVNHNSPLTLFNNVTPQIINSLKEEGNKVSELLNYNEDTSNRISNDIKDSLHNVKYYLLFEKVCEAIIEQLNDLNIKLNYGDDKFAAHLRENNLKQLKERYTMASEHLIHDQITRLGRGLTNEETEKNILEIAPNENSGADDDNLELF